MPKNNDPRINAPTLEIGKTLHESLNCGDEYVMIEEKNKRERHVSLNRNVVTSDKTACTTFKNSAKYSYCYGRTIVLSIIERSMIGINRGSDVIHVSPNPTIAYDSDAIILNRDRRCASISERWPLQNHFRRVGGTRILRGEHCHGINHA